MFVSIILHRFNHYIHVKFIGIIKDHVINYKYIHKNLFSSFFTMPEKKNDKDFCNLQKCIWDVE